MEQLTKLASKALSQNSETPQKVLEKAQYMDAARMLLGCYRMGDANDPEVYIAAVVRVLSGFPLDVVNRVIDPLTGIPSKIKWLPTVPEIIASCEEIRGLSRRIQEYEQRSQAQLAARELPRSTETINEMWTDMQRRGWQPTDQQFTPTVETVEAVKQKLGLTDEQWNALPDLPERSRDWERKRIDQR